MFEWIIAGRKNHSSQWYITAWIVTISLIFMGIYMQIYALSVVIVLLAGVYVMLENNGPEEIMIQISEVGINIWNQMFDYGQIENFSIVFDSSVPRQLKIRLKSTGIKSMEVDLSGFGYNIADLRAFLLNFIPEGEAGEITLTEKIAESLGL
jgi:hypothetical protein